MNIAVLLAGLGLCLSAAGAARADQPGDGNERIWLEAHNRASTDFGSSPLRWSDELAGEARAWALKLARQQRMEHARPDRRKGRGENLWMGTRGYLSAQQMIASFVDERRHFVPGRFPEVSRTGRWSDVGHYTQIVWPQTREVGCALAPGAEFEVLVCRYYPAGNRIGETITANRRVAAAR